MDKALDHENRIDLSSQNVILLHGIGRTSLSLKTIEGALYKEGFTVINLDYPARQKSLKQIAALLYTQIRQSLSQQKNNPLHFVTHSMGGLVLRILLSDYPFLKVNKIVMLAPPNRGSEVANFFHKNQIYRWFYGPSGQQLTTVAAQKLPNLPNDCEIGIIAGSRCIDPLCYFLLPKGNDGKVSINSTKLDNMRDHIILPVDHFFMVNQPEVILQVKAFLKHGIFEHSKV